MESIVKFSLLVLLAISLAACSGDGGTWINPTITNANAPQISSMVIAPTTATAGASVNLSATITFTDANGDLDAATFHYTYGGQEYSIPFSVPQGVTSGVVTATGTFTLNSTVGDISISAWIVDKGGNRSNTFTVTLTQTAAGSATTKQLGTSGDDMSNAIAVDSEGNVYIAGNTTGTFPGAAAGGAFISKIDASGTLVKTYQFGGATDEIKGIAIDGDGNIIVAGNGDGGNGGSYKIFCKKLTPNLTEIWSRGRYTTQTVTINGLALDPANGIYLVGETKSNIDSKTITGLSDGLALKYDTTGAWQWTSLINGSNLNDIAYAATFGGGYLHVVGSSNSASYGYEGFRIDLDPDTGLGGMQSYGGDGMSNDQGNAVAYDTANNKIYVTGYTDSAYSYYGYTNAGSSDAFFIKYTFNTGTANCTFNYVKQFGTAGYDNGKAIAVDGSGNVYVAGYVGGAIDGEAFPWANPAGFITKYDVNGVRQWTRLFGGSSFVNPMAMQLVGNKIYITGVTFGALDGMTSQGGSDTFVVIYDTNGVKQ